MFRGRARKKVYSAVNIRVFARDETVQRLDHLLRFLRRRGVIQINQRFSVHLRREDRKIGPQCGDIVRYAFERGCALIAKPLRQPQAPPPTRATLNCELPRPPISLYRLRQEGADQNQFCFLFRNAARAQIKQRIVIQRADRRTVTAQHVVGEDFEFGFRIGFGVRRKQQRPEQPDGSPISRILP